MDWASTWEYLSGQGIMFWTATVAVALGSTLILAAVHLQWRRLRSRPAKHVSTEQTPKPATLPDPVPVRPGGDRDPENETKSSGPQPAVFDQDHLEMGVLVSRLQSAANRLAAYQNSRLPNPTEIGDSYLKADPDGVEYLFRAGKG